MQNVFVVGLDDFHLPLIQASCADAPVALHTLFGQKDIRRAQRLPAARLLEEGQQRLRDFPGHVDAVVGYWDFPVSTMLPILRAPLGLPGPTLEAVLRCEHKLWSRMCQAEAVPSHVPDFCAVNPFDSDPLASLCIDFPFWLKPVRGVLSHLGFRIDDEAGFRAAIGRIRSGIWRFAEPFNVFLDYAELPPEIAGVDGWHCIAEGLISSGQQCTQEGYSYHGDVHVYGTVDSFRGGPTGSSFTRYQYPSRLPAPVLERMSAISRTLIRHLGYDNAPFNIEYFWDEHTGQIWLLEINARLSKSHAPLFELVDGRPHFRIMVDLGLGLRPNFEQGRGRYALAAKFMVRRFEDALVTRVPTAAEIAAVEASVPGCRILMPVREGATLSAMADQDSYSYEVATLFIGADDAAQLESRFEACMAHLPLRFAPVSGRRASINRP